MQGNPVVGMAATLLTGARGQGVQSLLPFLLLLQLVVLNQKIVRLAPAISRADQS